MPLIVYPAASDDLVPAHPSQLLIALQNDVLPIDRNQTFINPCFPEKLDIIEAFR